MKSSQVKNQVLIAEDERALSIAIAATVESCGGTPLRVASLAQAQHALKDYHLSAIILDIGLPDGNGLSLLESIPEKIPVIVVTAHGEIENAIRARKIGVREFFDKPIEFDAFRRCLTGIFKEFDIQKKSLPTEEKNSATFIGAAPAMRPVFQKIAHACASEDPVLIVGETGSGKSAVAQLIAKEASGNHTKGTIDWFSRKDLDVSSLAKSCVLIDPVSRLILSDQTQILEILEWEPAPSFRILATSDTDLRSLVQSGQLRSELYYRLQVLEIQLPRLRDRLDDLPALAEFFLGRIEKEVVSLSPGTIAILRSHDWPGNLRELQNVIKYANTIRAGNAEILPEHLPEHLLDCVSTEEEIVNTALAEAIDVWLGDTLELPDYRTISRELERTLIERLLARFDNKLAPLAKRLSANRTTLRKKLAKTGN